MDIILSGGVVVDGSGAPRFRGDVRVTGDLIRWVGEGPRDGAEAVDVSGHIVCPGFVDFHAHTDMTALVNPTVESKLAQGVTLEVNGNCGFSDAPVLSPEARDRAAKGFRRLGAGLTWSHFGEMLDVLERSGVAVNVCTLVGHANIRREVVGSEDRPASPEELERMRGLVARAMDEGAVGLSSGLIYPPGSYAPAEELAFLARAVASRGGFYATHMRSESDGLLQSVREAIAVGEQSGAPVQISHLKACGASNHGKAAGALELIREARERGVDVTADQYPYIATCTGLDTIIPAWAHSGGPEAMRQRLADPSERGRIRDEIARSLESGYWRDSGGLESIVISSVTEDRNRWAEGLSAAEVAARIGGDPVDALLDFLAGEDFGVGMVHFCLSETDVEAVMRAPWTLFGSDETARACSGPMGRGKPHPRAFGTFPRILARYVRERKVLSLEQAIRKMTSLATERLGIRDRGRIAPGMKADIVVFHPENVCDTATFSDPQRLPEGILHVLVNGRFALRDGKITGETPGRVLRGTA